MIHGLFLDPRTWNIDYLPSVFWKPEQYGVKIDLHQEAFNIPKYGVDRKYQFAIATEVWEIPMRKTLKYLRKNGIKVFLIPREPIKAKNLYSAMFHYERFLFDGSYYFTPDLVLCPGNEYAAAWAEKTRVSVVGYPRFEQYLMPRSSTDIFARYGLENNKPVLFFPSFPAYYYFKHDGKDSFIDLRQEHEDIMEALEVLTDQFRVVVKIHPVSQKCYNKGTGTGKEIFGKLKQYYDGKSKDLVVIRDQRNNGGISKDLLSISNVVVGFASTMLLEAFILKKAVVNVMFGKMQELGQTIEYDQDFPTAYSVKELVDLVRVAKVVDRSQVFSSYLYKVDGKFCERICGVIKEECK